MLLEDMMKFIPKEWDVMNIVTEKFRIIPLHPLSYEYGMVRNSVDQGNFIEFIQGIYRIQNPMLYTKFKLKIYEMEQKGPYNILNLYHDTCRKNVLSIASFNFDWRYGSRFMYGPGVYFSAKPYLANKHSKKDGSNCRSMFLVDVITQNIQRVYSDVFLPDVGFDTVLCHKEETYVKYYDGEYYPKYFVDYVF